jgi:DNA-binding transcriptional regulator YiaG
MPRSGETAPTLRKSRQSAKRKHVSHPVVTRYLNVSKNLISDWEQGTKRPGAEVAFDHPEQGPGDGG